MTKAERARLAKLKEMPCIACGRHGVDVHHLTEGGRRLGHMFTIPLCPWCHRGQPECGFMPATMFSLVGPSLALNKRAFVAKYGDERELLAKVNEMRGESPTSDSG